MYSFPRQYRRYAWGAGLFISLVVAIHYLLPFVANTAAAHSLIIAKASSVFSVEVDFETIKPALLPLPHVEIKQGRLYRKKGINLRFAKAVIYPRLASLFLVNLKIRRLKIVKPDASIPLPAGFSEVAKDSGVLSPRAISLQLRDQLATAIRITGISAVDIEDGRLMLTRPDHPDAEFTKISLDAGMSGDKMGFQATGQGDLFRWLDFRGRIDLENGAVNSRVEIAGLDTAQLALIVGVPPALPIPEMVTDLTVNMKNRGFDSFLFDVQAKTPEMTFNRDLQQVRIRDIVVKASVDWTDGKIQIHVSKMKSNSPSMDLNGSASWSLSPGFSVLPEQMQIKGNNLKVPEIRDAAMNLAGDLHFLRNIFGIVRSGRIPSLMISMESANAMAENINNRIYLRGSLVDGQIALPYKQLVFEAVDGQIALENGRLSAHNLNGRLGGHMMQNGTLQLGLFDGTRALKLDSSIDVDLKELPDTLQALATGSAVANKLDQLPPISGRAKGRMRLGGAMNHIVASISVGGHMTALDAELDLSVSIDGLPSRETNAQIELSGTVGTSAAQWLERWGGVPAEYVLKAPFVITRMHISRSTMDLLSFDGTLDFAEGLQVTGKIDYDGSKLNVSKLRLKDSSSDALMTIRFERDGSRWQAGFSGRLEKSTVDKALQINKIVQGRIEGNLQVDVRTDTPAQSKIQGRLAVQKLFIPLGSKLMPSISRASLEGRDNRFDIASAELTWHGNTARLTGSGSLTSDGLNLDFTSTAKSLDADRIIQVVRAYLSETGKKQPEGNNSFPIFGNIRVNTERLLYGGYEFSPFQAVVTLQDRQTSVDIGAAELCGIRTTGQILLDQGNIKMTFKPQAEKAALRMTDACLAGSKITERLEGTVNITGNIESHGQNGEELIRNLTGPVDIQITDGRVYNVGAAGFFTNLLSFISINQLIEEGLPDLRKNDFQYKTLVVKMFCRDGKLRIEEGVLKSNAVNIVGDGDVSLQSKALDLVVLVSPLTTVDWIVERIPLIGNILQGTLVAIPVGIEGPVVDPKVVPLSPSAVGSRLGGILERTIKTPFRILSPLFNDDTPPQP